MKTATTKKNMPELRFPDFDKKWEAKKLSEILSEHKTRNTKLKYKEVFSVAKNKGVVNQIEHLGRSYAAENLENYKVIFPGDVVYTKSPTADFPYGIIKQNKLNRAGVVSTLYAVYNPKNIYIGGLLNEYFLSWVRTYNYLVPLVQKGAKNTINIGNKDFLNGAKIFLPPTENEQKRIVDFFEATDAVIRNIKAQKENLEKYKRGMMQKIFSQEVRFKDDNGNDFPEWKESSLKDIFKKRSARNNGSEHKNVLTNSAQYGVVNQSEYFDKDIANQDNLTNYYVVETDDFVYNPRISKFAPVGPFKRNKNGRGIMSPLYTILKLSKGNLSFYEYYFDTNLWHRYMFKISNFGARHDRMNIRGEDFMKMPIPFPDAKEQEKIASFLIAIDKLISMKAEQVKNAETWKKGLLQKMFV